MVKDIFLPPAVRDLIEQVRDPHQRDIYYQDRLVERLENIEQACRIAVEEFRRRRKRVMERSR
jgi:hypothetical protein